MQYWRGVKEALYERTSLCNVLREGFWPTTRVEANCRAPILEECPQHHGHKGDPGVTPGTCGAIGERAQVILVWMRAPGRWERLPPTETRSHEG